MSSPHISEPFIIFSGGLSYDKAGRRHTLTIMHGKAITVLEMDYPIVEFMALCETPYNNGGCGPGGRPLAVWISTVETEVFHLVVPEVQEPYAVVVLLEKDLIVVDLTQSKYVSHVHTPPRSPIPSSRIMTFGDAIIVTSCRESISLALS